MAPIMMSPSRAMVVMVASMFHSLCSRACFKPTGATCILCHFSRYADYAWLASASRRALSSKTQAYNQRLGARNAPHFSQDAGRRGAGLKC